MRCIVFYCHVRPVWLYNIFPHYHKQQVFEKNVITHKMRFDFLYILSATFLILRIIQRDIITNVQYVGLLVK